MIITMILLFVVGYAAIALEHLLKINKAAFALLLCVVLWVVYILNAASILPASAEFTLFAQDAAKEHLSSFDKIISFVTEKQIIEHIGDVAEILFFLMGAMTIVELVDVHGGFSLITDWITTRNKRKLLWLLSAITFVMSALLDNMTTAIVMIMLLRKFIGNFKERWLFAGIIIIAANSGGAFSPIGDVTTIMLWVKGNVTTGEILPNLIIPSLLSVLVPVLIVSRMLKGEFTRPISNHDTESSNHLETARYLNRSEKRTIFMLGLGSLVFVPIFRALTNLPPFIGVLFGLSVLWIYTELLYQRKQNIPEHDKARITIILGRIDIATILFFLGILMSVAALECSGILHSFSIFLAEKVGDIYVINILVGMLSSIVDNVPLVAGAMGMYPLANDTIIAAAADPVYMANFVQDGTFWLFLAYCAGVGGSILIIGSAAGVVTMGLEKINFVWYFKNITLLVFLGYLAGAAFFIVQELWLRPLLGLF
ncbi:MAG: sodium:proton antiporter NhaD [Prevotellaceae bacterium]|jgi:Na+/H+ antiporter NhaD/arsenite permease-like protein|nr:sodium:proton antiporter NhaD [Prevotellaceae bacterium]